MNDFLLNAKDACDLVAHFKQSQTETKEEYEKKSTTNCREEFRENK